MAGQESIEQAVEDIYRQDSRRIFATLVRLLGDFDLAEEALHEAFATALAKWPSQGVPQQPSAWLVSAGRFHAIDSLRRRARFDASLDTLAKLLPPSEPAEQFDDERLRDDQLRLIFTCCHPALAPDVQVALTLREVCGLKTEEVARAFLTAPATMAQRIVRGKAKIKAASIPFQPPTPAELPARLDAVLAVIYLVYNEGYSASSGEQAVRVDLSGEAIRLGRLLADLLPQAEAFGLLALMLLHESRRAARTDPAGDLVLLEDQDREQWDQSLIEEGRRLIQRADSHHPRGPYALQAGISATHAAARAPEETDWAEIVQLYDRLQQVRPSPVVQLNRAVAVAMRDGFEAGLRLVDDLLAQGELADYHLAHAARADLCRRLGRRSQARESYSRALELCTQSAERRFLTKRLAEVS